MHAEGNYSHDWLASQPADHWRSQAEETRAGGMTGMGIHLLDAFSHLVGPMQRVSALSTRRALALPTGDTTAALIAFANGATGTLATTLKTPFIWRVAIYGSDAWAESASETRLIVRRAGGEPVVRDFAACDHLRHEPGGVRLRGARTPRVPHRCCRHPAHRRRTRGGVSLGRGQRRMAVRRVMLQPVDGACTRPKLERRET